MLLYVKLIHCSGFPEIYAWLEEGVGSVCHGYMCMLLYVKLIWCSGFPEIYALLGGMSAFSICAFFYMWNLCGVVVFQTSMLNWGWGQSAMGICEFFNMSNCFGVAVFYRSIVNWRRGWGESAMGICAFCYIWQLFGVLVFQRSMPYWRRGGVNLPWVYVHSAIYETYVV